MNLYLLTVLTMIIATELNGMAIELYNVAEQ